MPRGSPTRGRAAWGGQFIGPIVVVLCVLLFYSPILLGVRSFPAGDFRDHFLPFGQFAHAALQRGDLPLWNPTTYSGHPFLADVQAAFYYPLSLFMHLISLPLSDAGARLYWLEVEAVLHTVLAGLFAMLWTRDLTGSRWAALLGGTTFALSGYLTGYPPVQLAVLRTAIWLPLLLFLLARAWRTPSQIGWWSGAGVVVAVMFLAGHSQTMMLVGYAAAGWVVALGVGMARPHWRHGLGLAWTGFLAVGLTAAQWLPSLEFVRQSVRASVDYEFVSGGFAWSDFWQLLLPGVLTVYSPLHISAAGVGLAITAVLASSTFRRNPRVDVGGEQVLTGIVPWRVGVTYLAAIVLLGLWVSLGDRGGLYGLLYRFAPGWGWFRGQERAAYLVTVGLVGLAAYGMALLPVIPNMLRRRIALTQAVVVFAVVYGFGVLWQLSGRTAVEHAGYLVVALMTLVTTTTMTALMWLPGWTGRRNAIVVGLCALTLLWANIGVNSTGETPANAAALRAEVVAIQDVVAADPVAAQGLPGRVYNEYRVPENYGIGSGTEDVWGSSPLRAARYAHLFEGFPLDRMWRLLGVQHVLTWRRELFGESDLLAEFPQTSDTTYLHRLPETPQRAWMVDEVIALDEDAILARLADHAVNLDRVAFVETPNARFAGQSARPVDGVIRLARVANERLQVAVESPAGGYLVVSEVWLPGWRVEGAICDGGACPAQDAEARPIFALARTNYTLLGLWVPAGRVSFDLVYAPQSVVWGLWVSAITLGLGVLVHVGVRIRRRR